MFKRAKVEAWFTGCNIKAGKTTMQFELDQEYKARLPEIALLTGMKITLEIIDDQQVLFVSKETGEIDEAEIDEAEIDEAEIDEAEIDEAEIDEAEIDEAEEPDDAA